MLYFIGFLEFLFAISLIWTIYSWFRSRKTNNKQIFHVSLMVSGGLLILGAVLTTIFLPTQNTTSSKEVKTEVSQKASSSQSKKSNSSSTNNEEDTVGGYTSKEVKSINKELKLDLADDQKDAENGDSNYNWAPYVLKIEIQKDKSAKVYVDGKFMELSESDKETVGNKTNGLIGRSIVMAGIDYTPEEGREGVYQSFYNGPQAIGHSKFSDHSEFKWYKEK